MSGSSMERIAAAAVGCLCAFWLSVPGHSVRLPGAGPAPRIERQYRFPGTRVAAPADGADHDIQTLIYEPVHVDGRPNEPLQMVPGPRQGMKAVRVANGSLSSLAFAPGDRGFAVEVWFRKNGPGAIRGNGGATDGTLVSVGGGYWDGFRVTTTYPEQTFGFEIGRPRPSSSAGFFGCGPLPDGVWHHVVATWDRTTMRLYLDGLLAGSTAYSGPFTPGDRFRIGYADAGWGSVKLDVAEVTLYEDPVDASYVLKRFLSSASLPNGAAELLQAEDAYALNDRQACARRCEAVIGNPNTPPDLRALARLLLARCARDLGQTSRACRLLGAVASDDRTIWALRRDALMMLGSSCIDDAGVPPERLLEMARRDVSSEESRQLRIGAARSFARHGDINRALRIYTELASSRDTPHTMKLQLSLEEANLLRGSGKLVDAANLYRTLASSPEAPQAMRGYARLLLARTQLAIGNDAAARRILKTIVEDASSAASHRLEAREELARMETHAMNSAASSRAHVPRDPAPGRTLYVSPAGSDTNPGTRLKPLKTFAGAAAAVRRIRARGARPPGGIRVFFLPGIYPMLSTVTLTSEDSGSPASPIVYAAAPGGLVRFNGGIQLKRFGPVTDPEALARIPAGMRSRVLQFDLSAEEAAAIPPLGPHGVGFAPAPVPRLYWNGRALFLARWPAKGWASTGEIVDAGGNGRGFTFRYQGDHPSRWASARDFFVHGYWGWLWADGAMGVASIDTREHTITTAQPSSYAPRAGMPWFAYNLLEELDVPGEWCLDVGRGKIYVLPPTRPGGAAIELSALKGPFIKLQGAADIRFQHLCFEAGASTGIEGDHCSRIAIEGCILRKLGGTAIALTHAQDCLVFGCTMHELARGAVSIAGGDRKTLASGNNIVEDCLIHDFSQWDRTYTPAVLTDGVGTRIAYNLIYNSPGHALRIEGNDHTIEFNEIHHVVTETDDQGGLDMWFNPSYRGVVIRYNFFHHMGDGTDRLMRAGVRLDDAISGVVIFGNVFWKASEGIFGAVQIHGGKENIVENNLFVDCKYAISFSPWGEERWLRFIESPEVVRALHQDVDIRKPPYSTRYPALAHLADRPDVNFIWRNVAVRCGAFMIRDGGREDTMDNVETSEDPGFEAPARGDFRIKAGSWIYSRSGFQPIPFREIGMYPHPLRAQPDE